jgi:hypothetical protein
MSDIIKIGGNQDLDPEERPKNPKQPDLDFIIPTEELSLPSKGLLYPGNKSTVSIKYMTADEDDILFSPDLIESGQVLDSLLEAAVKDRDLRPDDILSGDRIHILISLRRTGLGDSYEHPSVLCSECRNIINKPVVDLSLLKPKELNVAPDANGEFSVQMPTTKINIKFRLLKGSDEKRLAKTAQFAKNKSVGGVKMRNNMITERYLLTIMEVNGNRDKLYIRKFISAMPTFDSTFFRQYLREVEPGVDLNYDFECQDCGAITTREITINSKLFYPEIDL